MRCPQGVSANAEPRQLYPRRIIPPNHLRDGDEHRDGLPVDVHPDPG